ncbi:hypothetical protein DFH09DRAFT_1110925 [Mycena vulgaris]|nr:hypothetical protein DFH09DRAFT_1110925 [Mycena vulgaris]
MSGSSPGMWKFMASSSLVQFLALSLPSAVFRTKYDSSMDCDDEDFEEFTIRNAPAAAAKFLVASPSLMKEKLKQQDKKCKQNQKNVTEAASAVSSKETQKAQKLANLKALPLSNKEGYKAVIDTMKEQTRNHFFTLSMPALMLTARQPWDQDIPPSFNYSELKPEAPVDSIQQQKLQLGHKGGARETGDKILYQKLLSLPSATIWASHMSQGSTNKNTAPNSHLFDASQHIKKTSTPADPAAAPALIPVKVKWSPQT